MLCKREATAVGSGCTTTREQIPLTATRESLPTTVKTQPKINKLIKKIFLGCISTVGASAIQGRGFALFLSRSLCHLALCLASNPSMVKCLFTGIFLNRVHSKLAQKCWGVSRTPPKFLQVHFLQCLVALVSPFRALLSCRCS